METPNVALTAEQTALIAALLACPDDQRVALLAAHRSCLHLSLIAALKDQTDHYKGNKPRLADAASRSALLVAQFLPDEPAALALASWARGNWQMDAAPQEAIGSYETALAYYRAVGDAQSVARLLGNLVSVFSDCQRFAQAQAAYEEARAIYQAQGPAAIPYLQALEQNYGYLLLDRGHYQDALAACDRALDLACQMDDPDGLVEVQVNRTLTLGMLGRLAEGITSLEHLREQAAHRGQHTTVARIHQYLGEFQTDLGQPARALPHLHAAHTWYEASGNHAEAGQALLAEGKLLDYLGALREARHCYAQALARFTANGMAGYAGETLVRLATAHRRSHDYEEAARLLDRAAACWNELNRWQVEVLFERAELALAWEDVASGRDLLPVLAHRPQTPRQLAQRDLLTADLWALQWRHHGAPEHRDRSRQAYEQALAWAQQHQDLWMQRRAWAGLGRLALSDQPPEARPLLKRAMSCDTLIRRTLSVEELKASFQAHTSDLSPLLIRQAVEQGQPLRALSETWQARGSGLLDLLWATEADREMPASLRAEIDQVRQQLASHRGRLALESKGKEPESWRERDDPTCRALEQQLADLRRRSNAATAHHDDHLLDEPGPLLRQMEADVLIEYVGCEGEVLALRADRDGSCRAVWLMEEDALRDLLDTLDLALQYGLTQRGNPALSHQDGGMAECLALLQQCHDRLLAPLGPLPDGAHLLIAPCAPLHSVPFAALWDGQRYLVERCTIEHLPTGALLAAPPPPAPSSALPLVVASSAGGRLMEVYEEAAAFQEAFPDGTALVDAPHDLATLQTLTAAPGLLHLSAHSTLRDDAPIFSALHLEGGLLAVEQCYTLPLAGTRLVTLGACATAAGMDTGGSLLAFQSAFFVAGVHRVVSSLWPVQSRATVTWMRLFYRALADGLPVVAALCQVQRTLLHDPASAHPALWAAFISSRR
ncbi:MAG: CHAT domain-containing protein [Chloroflexaceae bacterium]|nr:CHAT domain-containing protein [Chloroflexaceae bacterium]